MPVTTETAESRSNKPGSNLLLEQAGVYLLGKHSFPRATF